MEVWKQLPLDRGFGVDLLLVLCWEEVDSVPSSTLAEQLSSSTCLIHLCIKMTTTKGLSEKKKGNGQEHTHTCLATKCETSNLCVGCTPTHPKNTFFQVYLFVAAISPVHLERTGPASLWVERGTEADVVSGCGADE